MNLKAICIIAGVVLLLAIPTWWPIGFYSLLRLSIFIVALMVAYGFYQSKITSWALIFCGVAFLFNPIAPIYLNKQTWVVFDFISAILFFIASQAHKK